MNKLLNINENLDLFMKVLFIKKKLLYFITYRENKKLKFCNKNTNIKKNSFRVLIELCKDIEINTFSII